MAEDTHGRLHVPGEASPGDPGDLLCPTCERPFAHSSPGPGSALIEPIPDRPPLLWLKVLSAAVGAAVLLGGSALAAYRLGVSNGAVSGSRPPVEASLATTPSASSLSSGPASWDASRAQSFESSPATFPAGSLPSTMTPSMDASLTARIQSLRESLRLGNDAFGLGDTGAYASGLPLGGAGSGAGGGTAGVPSGPSAGEIDLSTRATLTASSVLAPARGFTYVPANLVDGRGDTCWAEGAPGYGIGQSVTFDFGREVAITRLEVLPGYDKRNEVDRWYSNGRLKTATLRTDSVSRPASFTDERRYQAVSLPSLRTRRLTVVISSAFSATPGPHSAEDTSVGEIRVYGR